jgi:hypothetical protein
MRAIPTFSTKFEAFQTDGEVAIITNAALIIATTILNVQCTDITSM